MPVFQVRSAETQLLHFPPLGKLNSFLPLFCAKLPGVAGDTVCVDAECCVANRGYPRHAFVGSSLRVATSPVLAPMGFMPGQPVSAENGVNVAPRALDIGDVYATIHKAAVFTQPADEAYVIFYLWARSNGATEKDSLEIPGGWYAIMQGHTYKPS